MFIVLRLLFRKDEIESFSCRRFTKTESSGPVLTHCSGNKTIKQHVHHSYLFLMSVFPLSHCLTFFTKIKRQKSCLYWSLLTSQLITQSTNQWTNISGSGMCVWPWTLTSLQLAPRSHRRRLVAPSAGLVSCIERGTKRLFHIFDFWWTARLKSPYSYGEGVVVVLYKYWFDAQLHLP